MSIKPEVHLDGDSDRHGSSAFLHCRLELVLPHGLERLLIQTHTQCANHTRILRIALRVDDQRDQANALILRTPRFIGKLCFRSEDSNRGRDAATNLVYAAAGIASSTRSKAVSSARTHATTVAGAHATAASLPIRGQCHIDRK